MECHSNFHLELFKRAAAGVFHQLSKASSLEFGDFQSYVLVPTCEMRRFITLER